MKRFWLAALLVALVLAIGASGMAAAEQTATYKEGDRGADVKALKVRLYELGYFSTTNLSNKYSEATVEAITDFQLQNGLEPTGEVTPDVWTLLFSDAAQAYVAPTPSPVPTPEPTATPAPTPKLEYPERDAEGYLTGAEDEFVYENDAGGMWVYLTDTLQITIVKHSDQSIPLEWFETDIKLRGDESILSVENNPKRPGTRFDYPFEIAQDNKYILGFSDDFYGHRISRKLTVGTVIRNGVVISAKTYSHENHMLPNLDMLVQFRDGSLKAYVCDEYTAQELLDMGAVNVFCFGPVLIRDGEINPLVLEKWFETKSPRQAFGMYEPGHYLLVSVCGRVDTSAGCGLIKLAELMKARGVTEALNLDGGNTMALVFRGRMLNKLASWKNKKFVRTVTSLIGIGVGDYVMDGLEYRK